MRLASDLKYTFNPVMNLNETKTRTDKKFEIDFSAYLNQGNWETHIPITLTIRTPMNECLQSEEETVKVVTRELFFTHKSYLSFGSRVSTTRYRGYFSHEPKIERTLEFFYLEDFNFRGIRDLLPTQTFDLLTGLPDFDTIWWKTPCNEMIGCSNFKHIIMRYSRQDNCFPNATGRITGYEIIRLSEDERIFRFEFIRPNHPNLKYEFTGKIIN